MASKKIFLVLGSVFLFGAIYIVHSISSSRLESKLYIESKEFADYFVNQYFGSPSVEYIRVHASEKLEAWMLASGSTWEGFLLDPDLGGLIEANYMNGSVYMFSDVDDVEGYWAGKHVYELIFKGSSRRIVLYLVLEEGLWKFNSYQLVN